MSRLHPTNVERHREGGKSGPTPAAAATGAEMVLMCVGNDHDVRMVITGPGGALSGMAAGAILVDHTTASAGAVLAEVIS